MLSLNILHLKDLSILYVSIHSYINYFKPFKQWQKHCFHRDIGRWVIEERIEIN